MDLPIVDSDPQSAGITWQGTRFSVTHNWADAFELLIEARGRAVGLGAVLGEKPKRAIEKLPPPLQAILARDRNKGYYLAVFD